MNRIRIFIFDDHAMIRESLAVLIGTQSDMEVIGGSGDASKAEEIYGRYRPDVVLMDLGMPGANGLQAAHSIRTKFNDARVIILTMHAGEEDVHRALTLGVKGYLLKEGMSTELFDAIRTVNSGGRYIPPAIAERLAQHASQAHLTDRELVILNRIASGQSNKQIAMDFQITEATVKGHVSNILNKLQAGDRTEAVTIALRRGIIRLD